MISTLFSGLYSMSSDSLEEAASSRVCQDKLLYNIK